MDGDDDRDRSVRSEGSGSGPETEEDDGLSDEQFRRLVVVSVGIGALFLLLIVGVTVGSHVYGLGDGPEGAPDTHFSVVAEERNGDLVANVTNEGPHAVNPDEIVIEVDGERRGDWTEVGGESGQGIVGAGQRAIVEDLEDGQLVTVYWVRGDQREELGQSEIQR